MAFGIQYINGASNLGIGLALHTCRHENLHGHTSGKSENNWKSGKSHYGNGNFRGISNIGLIFPPHVDLGLISSPFEKDSDLLHSVASSHYSEASSQQCRATVPNRGIQALPVDVSLQHSNSSHRWRGQGSSVVQVSSAAETRTLHIDGEGKFHPWCRCLHRGDFTSSSSLVEMK
jgi:hypothetical protein